MADVMIKCPVTGNAIPTGIGMPYEMLKDVELENNTVDCAECGGSHVWNKEDAFADS